MSKIVPVITKEQFCEIIEMLKEQQDKDREFAVFMEKYLDGRFVPMMSERAQSAAMKALSAIFNDVVGDSDETEDTWMEWFAYDCDWGNNEKNLTATIDGKEYTVKSAGDMYELLVAWMNFKVNGKA